jgi:hypothetical protein
MVGSQVAINILVGGGSGPARAIIDLRRRRISSARRADGDMARAEAGVPGSLRGSVQVQRSTLQVRTPVDQVTMVDGDRPWVVGRARAADIVISDARVSRRHLVIEPSGGGWKVRDTSANGLWIDGRRVPDFEVVGTVAFRLGAADGPEMVIIPQRAQKPGALPPTSPSPCALRAARPVRAARPRRAAPPPHASPTRPPAPACPTEAGPQRDGDVSRRFRGNGRDVRRPVRSPATPRPPSSPS